MEADFKIVKTETCWYSPWHVFVIFKCLQDCQSRFTSIEGDGIWFAKKGDYIRLRLNKKHCPIFGRLVNLGYLLPEASEQNSIGWYWDYEQ